MTAFDTPGRSTRRLAEVTGEIDPIDRAIREAGRIVNSGPQHHRLVARRRSRGRFSWSLADHAVSPHRVIAEGRTWTRRGAWRKSSRAYHAELGRLATERAGLFGRRGDELEAL